MLGWLGYGAAAQVPGAGTDRDELNRLKHSLSLLSPHMVQDNYLQSLEKCRLRNGAPPPPRFVQELVTAWRVLWRWTR